MKEPKGPSSFSAYNNLRSARVEIKAWLCILLISFVALAVKFAVGDSQSAYGLAWGLAAVFGGGMIFLLTLVLKRLSWLRTTKAGIMLGFLILILVIARYCIVGS